MIGSLQITGLKIKSPMPTTKSKPTPKKESIPKKTLQKTTNSAIKKVQIKKNIIVQQNNNIQQKIQQPVTKIQQPPTKKIEQPPSQIKQQKPIIIEPPKQYLITVRYNHYKDKFIAIGDILNFNIIDQKYGFNLVFKGNYIPFLKTYKTKEEIQFIRDPLDQRLFKWNVHENQQYVLQIRQDQVQQSKYEKKVYIAPKKEPECNLKKKYMVDLLTQDMKKLDINELGSEKHRQMLEQRDLQDVLFG